MDPPAKRRGRHQRRGKVGVVVAVQILRHKVVNSHGGGCPATREEVCGHFTFSLHLHFAPALELVGAVLEDLVHVLSDLGVVGQPGGVHPAGHVDCVAPDVVLRLPGPDDPGHHGADVHPDPEHEVVVAVLVEAGQLLPHGEDVLRELDDCRDGGLATVIHLVQNSQLRNEADGGHVGTAHSLDFIHCSESLVSEEFIKVNNNLIEKPVMLLVKDWGKFGVIKSPDALYALVVPVQLCVELVEVGDGGEYDAHSCVGLTVQFLEQNKIKNSRLDRSFKTIQ